MSSTSGTYGYSTSVIALVTAALQLDQVIADEETPTGAQLSAGMDALAAMVKGWQAAAIHVWCEEEATLFLQPGQILYYLGGTSDDHASITSAYVRTALSANAAAAATSIVVDSTLRITNGFQIGIQLVDGTNFWTTVSGTPVGSTVTLTDALSAAALADAYVFCYGTPLVRPLRVYGARRHQYQSAIETPVLMMGRLDYQQLPNKQTTGIVTQFFYDPQTGVNQNSYAQASALGQMNVWPNPQNNEFSLRFTMQRPLQDIASLANAPDFPVEWNAALKWNLALELAPQYGVPADQLQIIQSQANRWYSLVQQWDREPESYLFGVAMQPGYRRG